MVEKLLAIFFLFLSLVYLYLARDLTIGTLAAPKTGIVPMAAGSVAVLLSLLLVIQNIKQKQTKKANKVNWRKFVFTIIGILIYVAILNVVGYFLATFIIMLYLLKVTDTMGWLVPVEIAAGVSISCYLIFEQYLGIHWL